MSTFEHLGDVRDAVAQTLTAGGFARVHTTLPDRVPSPPTVYVTPGEPYVTSEGCNFGQVQVRTTVVLVAGKGTNAKVVAQLDQMIEDALVALYGAGWGGDVGRPGQINLNGQDHTAVAVDVTSIVEL